MSRARVVFYSKGDFAAGYQLQLAEKVLNAFDEHFEYQEINDILELASIQCYFKNEMFLNSWTLEIITSYRASVRKFSKIIASFLKAWVEKDFFEDYDSVQYEYRSVLWECISDYGSYKKLAKNLFSEWLKKHEHELYEVLCQNKIVSYFSAELLPVIKKSKVAEELLIEYSLFNPQNRIFWPKSLSDKEKREMVVDYIGNKNANVNYFKKIRDASRNAKPKVNEELRLLAKQAYDAWVSKQSLNRWASVQVSYVPSMELPIRYNEGDKTILVECNSEWVRTHLDFQSIFAMLSKGFGFIDSNHRSNLPFYSEDETPYLERGTEGDNGEIYPKDCLKLMLRNRMYGLMIDSYRKELWKNGIYFEDIFRCFFHDFLPQVYGIKNFSFNPPSINTTELEKIKIILPEIERLLKCYKLFQKNDCIESILLKAFSSPLGDIGELKSLSKEKYAYPAKDGYGVFNVMYSQCFTVTPLLDSEKKLYNSFYERLQKKKVRWDDLNEYCKDLLQNPINAECIYVDEGVVKLRKKTCALLKMIYDHDVVNLLPLKESEKMILRNLSEKGIVEISNSLFSRNAQDYIAYVWGDKFKNGLAIRNRYLHGAYSDDSSRIHEDYIELLKILTMIMIDLNDEFANLKRN